jgi:hypothetical protein
MKLRKPKLEGRRGEGGKGWKKPGGGIGKVNEEAKFGGEETQFMRGGQLKSRSLN